MSQMLIDYYRAIEDSSGKMLEAAKLEDWDGVMLFEGTCAVLIEQLRQRAQREELNLQSKAEKAQIMCRILHNDAQIRYLVEPWLAHIDSSYLAKNAYLH